MLTKVKRTTKVTIELDEEELIALQTLCWPLTRVSEAVVAQVRDCGMKLPPNDESVYPHNNAEFFVNKFMQSLYSKLSDCLLKEPSTKDRWNSFINIYPKG